MTYPGSSRSATQSQAADLIRELKENGEPLVITQNGEATA